LVRFPPLLPSRSSNEVVPAEAVKLSGYLKDSKLVVVETSSHMPMLEQPDTVNDLIAKFVTNPQ